MPTYYNAGPDAVGVDHLIPESADKATNKALEDARAKAREEWNKHNPLTMPARDRLAHKDGKVFIKKPLAFCSSDIHGNPIQQYEEWAPGSVSLALVGHGFYVVKPGGSVIVDSSVPEHVVKAHAPHLLTEAEYEAFKANKQPAAAEAKPEPKKEKVSAKPELKA